MRFTYSSNLREHHAAAMAIGLPPSAVSIVVPPNILNFEISGDRPTSCLGGVSGQSKNLKQLLGTVSKIKVDFFKTLLIK